jgi:hypothetical protein
MRSLTSWTAVSAVLSLAACTQVERGFGGGPGTSSSSSSTSTGGGATGGSATGGGSTGSGGSTSTSSTSSTTTSTTTTCTPEADAAFCASLTSQCDMVTGPDNCGATRTVNCGACSGTDVCVANVCKAPVCSTLSFGAGTSIPSVNVAGVQNMLSAVTPDGGSILFKRASSACASYEVFVGDAMPPSMSYTLSSVPALSGMDLTDEEYATLTDNGLTIVAANTAHTGLLASTRSAKFKVDFAAPTNAPFTNITTMGTQALSFPYLVPGQLELYYVIGGATITSLNGIYHATRASVSVPFGAGVQMPAPVANYYYVTAVSADNMTIFLNTTSYSMVVLTRSDVSQPFSIPGDAGAPPVVPGWRTRPIDSCQTLVGTCQVNTVGGGCLSERICTFPAQ